MPRTVDAQHPTLALAAPGRPAHFRSPRITRSRNPPPPPSGCRGGLKIGVPSGEMVVMGVRFTPPRGSRATPRCASVCSAAALSRDCRTTASSTTGGCGSCSCRGIASGRCRCCTGAATRAFPLRECSRSSGARRWASARPCWTVAGSTVSTARSCRCRRATRWDGCVPTTWSRGSTPAGRSRPCRRARTWPGPREPDQDPVSLVRTP